MRHIDTNTFPRTYEDLTDALNNDIVVPNFETILKTTAVIGTIDSYRLVYTRNRRWVENGNEDESINMGEIVEFSIHFDKFELFKFLINTHFDLRREFLVRYNETSNRIQRMHSLIDNAINRGPELVEAQNVLRDVERQFNEYNGILERVRKETDSIFVVTVRSENNKYLNEFTPYVDSISCIIHLVETYGTTLNVE